MAPAVNRIAPRGGRRFDPCHASQMKQTIIIVLFYVIALASSLTWIYTIGQQYVEPEIEVEEESEIIFSYSVYKGNPVAISFCRRSEFLVKLYGLRETAFRQKVLEGLDTSDLIARFDGQIDKQRVKLESDIQILESEGLDPPDANVCNYIW